MVQRSYGQRARRGERAEPTGDGTITDLGTLVIIDDDDEEMDTMKSELENKT